MRTAAARQRRPIEVVASEEPAFNRFSLDPEVELVLPLNELAAENADDLSGASLRFIGAGEDAHLSAYVGDYPLGVILGSMLRAFALELRDSIACNGAPSGAAIPLLSIHPKLENRVSAFELRCSQYGTLSVTTADGAHCFGIAQGATLKHFASAVLERSQAGLFDSAGRPKVISIVEGMR
jgi:hypothetical protein